MQRILNYYFWLTIALVSISFIYNRQMGEDGGIWAIVSQFNVVVLFIVSIIKNIAERNNLPSIIKLWAGFIGLAIIFYFAIPFYASEAFLGDIREMIIPFAITYSGYSLLRTRQQDFKIIYSIICLCSIVSMILILLNSGGFEIFAYYSERWGIAKNQTAPFFAQIGLIGIILTFKERNIIFKCIYLATFGFAFSYSVIIHARTTMICLIGLLFIILWIRYKAKALYISALIVLVGGFLFSSQIEELFIESFVGGGKELNDADSLTSGRITRLEETRDILSEHPLFGCLDLNATKQVWRSDYEVPHMYIAWKLLKFGFIGAIPFLAAYFLVLIFGVKLAMSNFRKYEMALICLAVAYITSLSEYSAPFGPGTSFIMCYMFLGYSIRQYYSKRIIRVNRISQRDSNAVVGRTGSI